MTGPRDPTPYEAEIYRQAAETRDRDWLRSIVFDLHPNIVWGSITRKLPEDDKQWLLKNLERKPLEPEDDDPSGYWGA